MAQLVFCPPMSQNRVYDSKSGQVSQIRPTLRLQSYPIFTNSKRFPEWLRIVYLASTPREGAKQNTLRASFVHGLARLLKNANVFAHCGLLLKSCRAVLHVVSLPRRMSTKIDWEVGHGSFSGCNNPKLDEMDIDPNRFRKRAGHQPNRPSLLVLSWSASTEDVERNEKSVDENRITFWLDGARRDA